MRSERLIGGGLFGVNVCARRISDGRRACRFSYCSHLICNGETDIIVGAGGRGKSNYAVTDPKCSSLLGSRRRNVVLCRRHYFICCCFGLTEVG